MSICYPMVIPVAAAGGLLLDGLAPTGAWSTRKLRTAYAGSALRVRRSSDNAEQDVGFSANALDTASMLTFTGAGNGFVTVWYDQSGNGRDLAQATAGNQPRIVNAGVVDTINSNPALRSASLATARLTSSAILSSFITNNSYMGIGSGSMLGATSPSGNNFDSARNFLVDDSGFWGGIGGYGLTSIFWGFYSSGYRQATVATPSYPATNVMLGRYEGTTIKGYLDGGTANTNSFSGTVGDVTAVVHATGSFNNAVPMDYTLEVIIFNADQTDAVCNSLGSSLATYLGTSWTNI